MLPILIPVVNGCSNSSCSAELSKIYECVKELESVLYYLKKFWKINTLACLFQVTTYGIQVLLNLVQMQLFNQIIAKDFRNFLFWLVVTLAGWAGYFLSRSIQTYYQGRAIKMMNNRLRLDMAATLLQKQHADFRATDRGEYLSWFTNDVRQIETLAWEPFYGMVGLVAQVFWSIAALASLHWSLLLASLVTTVIMMTAPKLFEKRMEQMGKENATAQAEGVSKFKDLLGGYEILRTFGHAERFAEKCATISEEIEQPSFRQKYMSGMIGGGMGFLVIFCQVLTNILIGFLSINGTIIQSALFGGGSLCGAVSNGLNDMANLRLSFAASSAYFQKIRNHAEDVPQQRNSSHGADCTTIEMENISFAYGDKQVLKNQSFLFEKGGKYALIGPSGCGKSTVLKLILGWLPEYQGTVLFDDKNAREFSQEERLQQMSYIEQDVFLFNTTIRDNITLGSDFTEEMLDRAIRGSALDGDLANMPLGLDTPVGEDGSNLSGGQKQRVAIARALIHNRSILLVDEGTSALDQKNADIVEESLLRNPDLTLILVSHHLTPERKAQFTKVYEMEPVGNTGLDMATE